jgi:hypothetical protein
MQSRATSTDAALSVSTGSSPSSPTIGTTPGSGTRFASQARRYEPSGWPWPPATAAFAQAGC